MDVRMDVLNRLNGFVDQVIENDRFATNLLALAAVLTAICFVWLVMRQIVAWIAGRPGQGTAWPWMNQTIEFLARQARALLGWLTFTAVTGAVMVGAAYHLAGRDIQADWRAWQNNLTWAQVEGLVWRGGELLVLAVTAWVAVRTVRRARKLLERRAARVLGRDLDTEVAARWFGLLERYALAVVLIAAGMAASHLAGFGWLTLAPGLFALRVISILAAARLLTLACRALSHPVAEMGERRLAGTRFVEYWQRLTRMFPLGERCFEAAVYIQAASLCVQEMRQFAFVALYGPKIVQCIGIFFGTRAIIELLQVLLNELFGLTGDGRTTDQKKQTLVPLLHSGCQYVLYFGALVMMLDVLGQDTKWLLAAAGTLGLAFGLGAQTLVTDIVSGFFILFEGQYLVGDYVEVGGAKGNVEAIAVRNTQIRDDQGKLYIIPNGQIKQVVNYSKGYVNAVVDIRVPLRGEVEEMHRAMTEAGRILRQTRREVLADTSVQGLVELSLAEITIRAVTKVRPGSHQIIENEYRRILQQVLNQPASPALRAA
jgi:moderate conductance mechanosensitive channel